MRRLGFTSAASLVVASMVGTGVFTTSGFALAELGSRELVLVAWVLGGAIATSGALCYGALGRRIPESGGEFTFITATVHPLAGFIAGWISLFVGFTAPIAAAALAFEAYVTSGVGITAGTGVISVVAIVAAGLAHGLYVRVGAVLQNALVIVLVISIVGFLATGAVSVPDATAEAPRVLGGPLDFALSVMWISFAYSGWNAATYVGGQVRDPERNLPRALLASTGIVTVLYLLLNGLFLYSAPYDVIAGRPDVAAAAAVALGGPTFGRALSVIVALALLTSVSSYIMAGPQVIARMSEDGLLPARFRTVRNAPGWAVALQVVLALVTLSIADLAELLGFLGFTLGLCAALTVGGLVRLRRREGPESVPVPGYPYVPAFFLVATLVMAFMMVLREPIIAGAGLLVAASAVPVYYWRR